MRLMTSTHQSILATKKGVEMIKHVSASSLSCFQQCEAKWWYQYHQGWRVKKKGKGLLTGLAMHEAQELFLKGDNLDAAIDSVEQDAISEGWDEDPLFLPKVRAYIKGYYKAWSGNQPQWFTDSEMIDLEGWFTYVPDEQAKSLFPFVGKIDGVYLDEANDRVIVLEHKNVSSKDATDLSSSFWRGLSMDTQLAIYADYFTKRYDKPVWVYYDVTITSPNSRIKSIWDGEKGKKVRRPETLEEFEERLTIDYVENGKDKYIRQLIPILDHNRERRMNELIQVANRMIGSPPIRNISSCKNFGGCEYLEVCLGNERLEESQKFYNTHK